MNEKRTARLELRLTFEEKEKLSKMAQERGKTIAQIIRELVINDKLITKKVTSYDEAKEILFNLEWDKEDSPYNEVKKLLHTFSHVLISRSSKRINIHAV